MLRKIFAVSVISLIALVATQRQTIAEDFEAGYSMPRIAPLYGKPPFHYSDSWWMTVEFKTTPEIARALVPEPLVPNPDNIVFVSIGHPKASGIGPYHEMILGIPSTFEGKSGNYAVYLYLDRDAPIAGGREIWGFPKKEARVTLTEKDGVVTGTVERGGIVLVRAAVELAKWVEPEESPPSPWFTFKLIPSVQKDAPPDVMQLTTTTSENRKIKKMYTGRATIEFGISPVDPLHKITVTKVLGGRYKLSDSDLTYGDVLYDYLTETQVAIKND